MAEVGLAFGLVDASAGLILKCGSVAKSLHDLTGKYKNAELTLKTIIQLVDVIKAAWIRIKEWDEQYQLYGDLSTAVVELWKRLGTSLECGDLAISALETDLGSFRSEKGPFGIKQRSRIIWDSTGLQDHQSRLRDQASAMGLLLQVLQL